MECFSKKTRELVSESFAYSYSSEWEKMATAEEEEVKVEVIPNRIGFDGREFMGITIALRGGCCIIYSPDELVEEIENFINININDIESVVEKEMWCNIFSRESLNFEGPARYCVADNNLFNYDNARVRHKKNVIRISEPKYHSYIKNLSDNLNDKERHKVKLLSHRPAYGYFVEDKLLCMSGFKLNENMLDITIATHPKYRGRGLAKSVLKETTRWGLKNGFLMGYYVHDSNSPSICVKNSVGYKTFFNMLTVKLYQDV